MHLVDPVTLGHDKGRAQNRVARERKLRGGREDADAVLREQEHGLREVELASGSLHHFVAQLSAVEEHPEGVALERRVGEHVEHEVRLHHRSTSAVTVLQLRAVPTMPGRDRAIVAHTAELRTPSVMVAREP